MSEERYRPCGADGCCYTDDKKTVESLRAENERLREGMKGDYDLDAWLDWAAEAKQLRAEVEDLREHNKAMSRVVDDNGNLASGRNENNRM